MRAETLRGMAARGRCPWLLRVLLTTPDGQRVAPDDRVAPAPTFFEGVLNTMRKITQVTATELAAHLGRCTRETIGDYVANDIIQKLPSGKFDQDDCRDRVFAHLRERAAGRVSGELLKQRTEQAKEQTEAMKLKNAIARGDYVSLSLVRKNLESMFLVLRTHILAMPGTTGDMMATALGVDREIVVRILTDVVYELLEHLSDPRYDKPKPAAAE
jgi:phage terminase Nu1 subunit (DNA packaging protein)